MTALQQAFRVGVEEPWLAFSRVLTCAYLGRAARPGANRPAAGRSRTRISHVATSPHAHHEEREEAAIRPTRIGYVAASTLPYHVSGYTTRTQEILTALGAAGADVVPFTRPGYPWDRSDRCCGPGGHETLVGGVRYRHLASPRNTWPVLFYAPRAASALVEAAKVHAIDALHAASNHVNALPALLAARRLGIPFQYEMRGLWELTRVSRQPGFEHSQAFLQGLQLERLVATQADRLFVISDQLRRHVCTQWGIPADKVALLPNCVDPTRFAVAGPDEVEPRTIGYAGALIGYEGLDTLIEAVALLKTRGVAVQVRIVGHGEAQAGLEALAGRLAVTDRVRFLGRLAPDAARAVIRSSAVVCLPRRPFEVCRIIPPIKLVEALAMGKPVIVSDLPVLRDELGAQPAGWFFQPGDAADLARVVQQAFADDGMLVRLGAQAREYAVAVRDWRSFVAPIMKA